MQLKTEFKKATEVELNAWNKLTILSFADDVVYAFSPLTYLSLFTKKLEDH
ncbi:hypothetical protein T08_2011 [Trichinella sp. T8]|uniref:Uncharacterized protein n=1 Tax=Trichinella murrelli TaxID=144512 RepID=A0A0V0UF22_9BILA|nr:hypothetical protein T05_13523 [Trichinella murrelli]KRZ95506.1 hypothetical protein T08_2011 [Trichinella sp. T8]